MQFRLALVATLHSASTAALDPSLLSEIRHLLYAAFEGHFSDEDWQHATGGIHVWLSGPQGLISHGSLVPRTLECSGRMLSLGYVEAVATASAFQRKGYATMVMTHIAELIGQRYVMGALSTGAHELYETLGWERWRGPTWVDTPGGRVRTPDEDGGVMILRSPRTPPLDLDQAIVCPWRTGDVW